MRRRGDELAPLIRAVRRRGDEVAHREIERFASRLAGLTIDERDAVEALARGITAKLLHDPIVALKERSAARHPSLSTLACSPSCSASTKSTSTRHLDDDTSLARRATTLPPPSS